MLADSGTDGAADPHADLAVSHDRAWGDPLCHPPQHLGGPLANQNPAASRGTHRCQGQANRGSAVRSVSCLNAFALHASERLPARCCSMLGMAAASCVKQIHRM